MPSHEVSPVEIEDLIVHLGRVSCSEELCSDLTATQWTCLRFLSRANGRTRTPSAFARFQATSRSTATHTIKSLEKLGFVVRRKVPGDGRSVRLDLTPEGWRMMLSDPLRQLAEFLNAMVPMEREMLNRLLIRLVDAMAVSRGAPSFGHCRDCAHYNRVEDRRYCSYMEEELSTGEVEQLCDRFNVAH